MTEKKTMGLKRSEVLKIEAAIVEIMENAGFNVLDNVDVVPTSTTGNFRMTFQKDKTSLATLNAIQDKLGNNFAISVAPMSKTIITVEIEASESDFIGLLG